MRPLAKCTDFDVSLRTRGRKLFVETTTPIEHNQELAMEKKFQLNQLSETLEHSRLDPELRRLPHQILAAQDRRRPSPGRSLPPGALHARAQDRTHRGGTPVTARRRPETHQEINA